MCTDKPGCSGLPAPVLWSSLRSMRCPPGAHFRSLPSTGTLTLVCLVFCTICYLFSTHVCVKENTRIPLKCRTEKDKPIWFHSTEFLCKLGALAAIWIMGDQCKGCERAKAWFPPMSSQIPPSPPYHTKIHRGNLGSPKYILCVFTFSIFIATFIVWATASLRSPNFLIDLLSCLSLIFLPSVHHRTVRSLFFKHSLNLLLPG